MKSKLFLFCLYIFQCIQNSQSTSVRNQMKIPAMARKAGGSWKPELIQTEVPRVEQSGQDYEEEYSASEEECDAGEFYHIRGKRCVPLKCDIGYKRDKDTGECWFMGRARSMWYGRRGGRRRCYKLRNGFCKPHYHSTSRVRVRRG